MGKLRPDTQAGESRLLRVRGLQCCICNHLAGGGDLEIESGEGEAAEGTRGKDRGWGTEESVIGVVGLG